jgi:hypothetical protein
VSQGLHIAGPRPHGMLSGEADRVLKNVGSHPQLGSRGLVFLPCLQLALLGTGTFRDMENGKGRHIVQRYSMRGAPQETDKWLVVSNVTGNLPTALYESLLTIFCGYEKGSQRGLPKRTLIP